MATMVIWGKERTMFKAKEEKHKPRIGDVVAFHYHEGAIHYYKDAILNAVLATVIPYETFKSGIENDVGKTGKRLSPQYDPKARGDTSPDTTYLKTARGM